MQALQLQKTYYNPQNFSYKMQTSQQTASFQQLLPVSSLSTNLKSNNWNMRKQMYQQILYLLQEMVQDGGGVRVLEIGGRQYTVKKLIPFFEDIVDEEHPGVLLAALMCVETMIQGGMCSGREFVKLTDQGFDKFPLKINKGKEIMQKFADIIEKIDLQPQFLIKKLSHNGHEKCVIFALEVVGMLGMTQLIGKVQEMGQKHPKSAVREVALQIEKELEELGNQDGEVIEESRISFNSNRKQIENIQTENINKTIKNKNRKKTPTKTNHQQSTTFTRSQLQILQKVSQFEQLKNSKQQQNFSQGLSQVLQRYFRSIKQGKPLPQLPMNQLTNLSYIIRVMVESNNAIISTNGLRILKTLVQHSSPLLPRSYPLLFIFQKFRLHATHQINQLLYELCDSLLLCYGVSGMRNVDLMQAVSEGAGNKKGNVRYGSWMVFVRVVAVLYGNERLFWDGDEGNGIGDILRKVNEGDVEKIRLKLYKILIKCFQNFNLKMNEDKKYEQKLQDIRITMSLAYGSGTSTTQSAVSSIQNLKNKTLKKTFSQVSPKVQTHNTQPRTPNQDLKKPRTTHSVRGQSNPVYKIVNPEQKSNKILDLCTNPTPGALSSMKKLVVESLVQFQECIEQHRFQLFYYSQVIDNFMNQYEPNEKTSDIISEYLLQLLVKISKIKNNSRNTSNVKLLREGLRNMLRISMCALVLGDGNLEQIMTSFAENLGISNVIEGLVMLNQSKKQIKIKKKNKKIVLEWLDSNVPNECLSDRLFQVMDRIEKGLPLGVEKEEPEIVIEEKKPLRGTFGRQDEGQMPVMPAKFEEPKMNKKFTFNTKLNEIPVQQPQIKRPPPLQNPIQKPKKQLPSYNDLKPQPSTTTPTIQALESSQISKISYKEDQSLMGSAFAGSTDRSMEHNMHPNINDQVNYGKKDRKFYDEEVQQDGDHQENNGSYQEYYTQYRKYKDMDEGEHEEPDFGVNKNRDRTLSGRKQDEESGKQEDQVELDTKIESYKEYIKKIRETYLPPAYINSEQQKQQQKQSILKDQKASQKIEEKLIQIPSKKHQEPKQPSVQQEQQQQKFQYKMLNTNKLSYMLHNSANPYTHLRNEIILPFKKSSNQVYFLQELNLYITSMPQIKTPQPYNSLLLTVVLLFSEIHTNRALVAPLQELYEFMAGLVTTNQFLRIVIGLFHSVIEETTLQLRAFLITILTKSVARLMPFCDDPVQLLRDLSQFYNVGQNVYFEMYEAQYRQICQVIEGQALYEVVQRALIKQRENLVVIVESWFETKLKKKIKEYMKEIMEENQEEGLEIQGGDGDQGYF